MVVSRPWPLFGELCFSASIFDRTTYSSRSSIFAKLYSSTSIQGSVRQILIVQRARLISLFFLVLRFRCPRARLIFTIQRPRLIFDVLVLIRVRCRRSLLNWCTLLLRFSICSSKTWKCQFQVFYFLFSDSPFFLKRSFWEQNLRSKQTSFMFWKFGKPKTSFGNVNIRILYTQTGLVGSRAAHRVLWGHS